MSNIIHRLYKKRTHLVKRSVSAKELGEILHKMAEAYILAAYCGALIYLASSRHYFGGETTNQRL